MRNQETVLNELLNWANSKKNIRAVVMTSSRANPKASIDIFSDYDIELIVTRLPDFSKNDKWIFHFGNPIADIKERNKKSLTQLVLYSDGVRIDFQLYTVSEFIRETKQSLLPEHWDIGYKVLLDKGGITQMLPWPKNAVYNISRPTEKEFTSLVKDFWWDTTYVAKSLWRDEIFYAKYIFESLIHNEYLKRMIEWYIGSKNNWMVNTNKYGRWFKRYLDNETWSQIEETFADSSIEKNWESLFATTRLFNRIATEVARQSNYEYSFTLEKNIIEYLKKIQRLKKNATHF
ncbi:MAG TPA: aminoglycoside 6-adenylyltransferase [Chitinophagaceae bacterium]|nr:aminoglycoside 6-adenylyltransferase [Chitinophagaceae bacterium]